MLVAWPGQDIGWCRLRNGGREEGLGLVGGRASRGEVLEGGITQNRLGLGWRNRSNRKGEDVDGWRGWMV